MDPLALLRLPEGTPSAYDIDELPGVLRRNGYPSGIVADAIRLAGQYKALRATGLLTTRIAIMGEIRRLKAKMVSALEDYITAEFDKDALEVKRRLDRIKTPSPVLASALYDPHKASVATISKKTAKALTNLIHRSHKFVFDEDACFRLGELIGGDSDLLVDAAEFIRPPFTTTWVEFNVDSVLAGLEQEPYEDCHLGGILFHGNSVYCAFPTDEGIPWWTPIRWRLNAGETPVEEFHALGLHTERAIDQFVWGKAGTRSEDPPFDLDILRRQHRMDMIAFDRSGVRLLESKEWPNLRAHLAGLLPLALGVGMLLMQPSFTRIIRDDDGTHRQKERGPRHRPYLAHTVVTIRMRREELVRKVERLVTEEHQMRRRHEVRGHYCHNKAARAAEHEHCWDEILPDHWECSVPGCTGMRWWRKAHERGDASLGFTTKHYVIKKE